jgi:sulfur carrier protein
MAGNDSLRYAHVMNLVVNGEPRAVSVEPPTVDALVLSLGLPRERVAVELNGAIVKKADRAACTLKDGDVLEIVTLVGGG